MSARRHFSGGIEIAEARDTSEAANGTLSFLGRDGLLLALTKDAKPSDHFERPQA